MESQQSLKIPLAMVLTGCAMLAAELLVGQNPNLMLRTLVWICSSALVAGGVRWMFAAFIDRYGSIHVPTWLGFLILFSMLAILPLLGFISWLLER
jgi:hypothetical protein